MSESDNDLARFQQDLTFYVNGTLDDERRAWMEAKLAEHPRWHEDVALERQIRELVREPARVSAAEPGWQALRARMVAEGVFDAKDRPAVDKSAQTPRPAAGTSSAWGWAQALVRPLAVPWPVLALGAVALIMQAYLLLVPSETAPEPESPLHRGVDSVAADCGTLIRIAVSPSLQVGELAAGLQSAGVSVRRGPLEGGEWLLAVPTGASADAARQVLLALPGIEEARIEPTATNGACP